MKVKLFILIIISAVLSANVNVVCKAGIMDNDSANIYINKLLKKEPENIECILKLANINLKSGNLLKGYKLIKRSYNINPLAVGRSNVANILPYALEMAELASQAKKNSDNSLWNKIGDNFFDMGVYGESIKAYEKSLALDLKQSKIRLKLAFSYKKNNQVNNAVEQLFTLVEQNKKDFYANYYLGKILRYSITDEDSAIKYFASAKTILLSTRDSFTDK